uniref:Asp_protease domain-containing protein n=1 Tax=Macrostomum lignano TaxID=282301 RepID=A0A1I8F9U5_9PLAT
KLTVTTLSGEGAVAQVDASPDMTVSELLAVCRAELRMPAGQQHSATDEEASRRGGLEPGDPSPSPAIDARTAGPPSPTESSAWPTPCPTRTDLPSLSERPSLSVTRRPRASPPDGRQSRFQSLIQQQNIDSSMETALEHMPEAFAPVNMLYIDVKAATISLATLALLRDQSMDLLLGLDMLKRHQLPAGPQGHSRPVSIRGRPARGRPGQRGGGSGGEGGKPITQESIDAVPGGPDGTTADDAREALMHALGEVDAAIAFLVAKQSERSGQ